jgi:hypothetical protein
MLYFSFKEEVEEIRNHVAIDAGFPEPLKAN